MDRTIEKAEAVDGMSEANVRKRNLKSKVLLVDTKDCGVHYSSHYKRMRQKQHTDDFNH